MCLSRTVALQRLRVASAMRSFSSSAVRAVESEAAKVSRQRRQGFLSEGIVGLQVVRPDVEVSHPLGRDWISADGVR